MTTSKAQYQAIMHFSTQPLDWYPLSQVQVNKVRVYQHLYLKTWENEPEKKVMGRIPSS